MIWTCGSQTIYLSQRPILMGILNATPDSFSDGFPSLSQAMDRAGTLLDQGADILDVGGESTRPGSCSVSAQEELDRIGPVLESLTSSTDIPLSVDTQKPEVAIQMVAMGANIINHVSGTLDFEAMIPVLTSCQAGYVSMHMKARPRIMQNSTHYDNLLGDILRELKKVQSRLQQEGIAAQRVVYDPGIGFGKTTEQCVQLLSNIASFHQALGRPILMGLSRKRWLKDLLDLKVDHRDEATATASALLPFPEVPIHRVHNVAMTRQALLLKGALENRNWDWQARVVQNV